MSMTPRLACLALLAAGLPSGAPAQKEIARWRQVARDANPQPE
jgi:hypothetical protein